MTKGEIELNLKFGKIKVMVFNMLVQWWSGPGFPLDGALWYSRIDRNPQPSLIPTFKKFINAPGYTRWHFFEVKSKFWDFHPKSNFYYSFCTVWGKKCGVTRIFGLKISICVFQFFLNYTRRTQMLPKQCLLSHIFLPHTVQKL